MNSDFVLCDHNVCILFSSFQYNFSGFIQESTAVPKLFGFLVSFFSLPLEVPSAVIFQIFTSLSLDPVARSLLSNENAQHVTYLQINILQ